MFFNSLEEPRGGKRVHWHLLQHSQNWAMSSSINISVSQRGPRIPSILLLQSALLKKHDALIDTALKKCSEVNLQSTLAIHIRKLVNQ